MATAILLTAEEADLVRGPSAVTPSAALAPIERTGGVFILGVEVLDDPAHKHHHEFLSSLPVLDDNDPNFPKNIEIDL